MTLGALRLPAMPEEPQSKASGDATARHPRLCLSCTSVFDSAWAGERICPRCKGTTAWRNGGSIATASAKASSRSGRKGST